MKIHTTKQLGKDQGISIKFIIGYASYESLFMLIRLGLSFVALDICKKTNFGS